MLNPQNNQPPNRRDFLRMLTVLSSAGLVSSFLNACARVGLATPGTATPTGITPASSATAASQPEAESTETPTGGGEEQSPSTPEPTQVEAAGAVQIALVKTASRAEGVRRAVELLGLNPIKDRSVFPQAQLQQRPSGARLNPPGRAAGARGTTAGNGGKKHHGRRPQRDGKYPHCHGTAGRVCAG